MKTHERFKARLLNKPEIKQAYDALGEEFTLFEEMLKARQTTKLTQMTARLTQMLDYKESTK